MTRRTPQEKKALSYAKDRRNSYGENDKASRKAIPKRKAEVNRSYRRKIEGAMNEILSTNDPEAMLEIADDASSIRRRDWKKAPDAPLGEVVEKKLKNRELHDGQGKTARKSAQTFIENLEIDVEKLDESKWIARAKEFPKLSATGADKERAIEKLKHIAKVAFRNENENVEIRVQMDGVFLSPRLS